MPKKFTYKEVKCPLCQKNIDNTLQKLKDLFGDNNPFNDLGIT